MNADLIYKINTYIILLGSIFTLFLALVAYARNRKSIINITFALFSIAISYWLLLTFFMFISPPSKAVFIDKLIYISVVFLGTLLYQFGLFFSKSEKRLTLYFGYIISILFLALIPTDFIIKDIFLYKWGVHAKAQTGHSLFLLFFFSYVLLFLVETLKFYKQRAKAIEREQARYVLIACVLLVILGPIGFLPAYGIAIYPFTSYLGGLLFTLFVAYAIIKHRLMDIRLLVLKSVAYSLTVALVVLGYITITIYVFSILDNIINPIVLNIFTIFILLFTFDPLKQNIEKYTNKFFAKNRYNPEVLWRALDEINITFARQEDLTKRWLDTITEQMNISKAAFLLLGSPIRYVQNVNFAEKTKKEWQEVAEVALSGNKTVVYDELDDCSVHREAMHKFNAEILIPVKKKSQVLGILVLGEKNSGDIYSVQDISFLEDFANRAAVALERSKEIKAKEKEIFKIKALYNQAEKSVSGISLDHVLNTTIDTAFMATDSDGGSIMLLDKSGQLAIRASRGIPSEFGVQSIGIGDGIAGRVALTRKPLIVDDRDPELATLLKREQIKSAMCVPMEVGGKLVGILSINRIYSDRPFTEHDLELVCTVAANIAHRIENTKLIQEERKRHKEVINIYAAATEARDPYTFGHSETVTLYAGAIARTMSLSKGHLNIIENAAILHDIGKIGIPDHILNKPGSLTKDEFHSIRQHPIIGERLIRQYSNLEDVAPLALHHHERYDGKGYPDQIKGKDIPLGARILAVADAFDAMTSDRPYKPALSLGQAKKELVTQSGGQFDPKVAEAFLELLDDNFFSESQEKKQLSKLTRLHH